VFFSVLKELPRYEDVSSTYLSITP